MAMAGVGSSVPAKFQRAWALRAWGNGEGSRAHLLVAWVGCGMTCGGGATGQTGRGGVLPWRRRSGGIGRGWLGLGALGRGGQASGVLNLGEAGVEGMFRGELRARRPWRAGWRCVVKGMAGVAIYRLG